MIYVDIFYLLLEIKMMHAWIDAVPLKTWRGVFGVLTRCTEQKDRERLKNHIESEGLFAIEMLSIWIAAEDMDPELMRMEPSLLNADSPFVALHHEVVNWLQAHRQSTVFANAQPIFYIG